MTKLKTMLMIMMMVLCTTHVLTSPYPTEYNHKDHNHIAFHKDVMLKHSGDKIPFQLKAEVTKRVNKAKGTRGVMGVIVVAKSFVSKGVVNNSVMIMSICQSTIDGVKVTYRSDWLLIYDNDYKITSESYQPHVSYSAY